MIKVLTTAKSGFWRILESGAFAELLGLTTSEQGSRTTWVTGGQVEVPGYGSQYVTLSLDSVGDTCLRTNLLVKRALAEAEAGDLIEIIADNLSSVETIPFMSPNYHGLHLATCRDARGWRIYVRKRALAVLDTAKTNDAPREQ